LLVAVLRLQITTHNPWPWQRRPQWEIRVKSRSYYIRRSSAAAENFKQLQLYNEYRVYPLSCCLHVFHMCVFKSFVCL